MIECDQSLVEGRVLRAISGDRVASEQVLTTKGLDTLGSSRIVRHLRSSQLFDVNRISVVKALINPQTFDSSYWLDQRIWNVVCLRDFITNLSAEGVDLLIGSAQSLIRGTRLPTRSIICTKIMRITQVVGQGMIINPVVFGEGVSAFLAGETDLPRSISDLLLANGGRPARRVDPILRRSLKEVLNG